MGERRRWWKEAVFYQIYPKSFRDSDGDGVGDLGGIIERLDHLQELGVDAVWLCPVYESPQVDNGYDISDYYRIYRRFGTLEQFDSLLQGLHERGIKLIMDLVVNHTSDRHRWFRESRSSRENPYRDYYIWRPGRREGEETASGYGSSGGRDAPGGIGPEGDEARLRPPNNWLSFFEGPAWQYDGTTGEYYLHLFASQQPDLNWENPRLREEIYEMMRWWLDRGVDGFRMDVINLISKDPDLPDSAGPGLSRILGGEYFINGPHVLRYLREMRRQVLDRYDVMTVGETPDVTPEQGLTYVNEEDGPLDMLFQFEHMDIDTGPEGFWSVGSFSLAQLKRILGSWQRELEGRGWNSLFLNNHDQPRMVSRFGDDGEYRIRSAKLLATMLHTLKGTPYIYQGEEIGMTNPSFSRIEDYRDVSTLNYYRRATEEEGLSHEEAMEVVRYRSRDNGRTPMQWDGSEQAGFTSGTPWIPVNPDYPHINVERERRDPDSVFNYYRRLIRLRREHPVIVYGSFTDLLPESESLYLYRREGEGELVHVLLNFTAAPTSCTVDIAEGLSSARLLIGNYSDTPAGIERGSRSLLLRPYEARVYGCRR